MKTTLLCLFSLALSAQLVCAQNAVSSGAPSVRDGFTKSGTDVLFTRNGATQKVEKEMLLDNGMRVRSDATVTLPNGNKATLRNNQLLTLQGTFEDAALTPQGTAPVTSGGPLITNHGREIGIAAADGVSVSSGAALVTRNGVTERLDKDLKLSNGTRVKADGTVTLTDGEKVSLRADQVLTFDGSLVDTPPRAATTQAPPDGITMHNGRAYFLRGGRAFAIDSTLVPNGQVLTSDGKLVPLQPGFTDFPQGSATNDATGNAGKQR